MKKVLLLALVAIVLSGCAPIGVAPNEGLVGDYAYVVGQKAGSNGNSFHFTNVAQKPMAAEWDMDFYLPNPSSDDSYVVQKVKPGRYIFEYIVQPSGWSRDVVELGSVLLEPGKINYIGTITVEHSQVVGTYSTRSSRVAPKVTYQPAIVKEIIRKQYPGLARDIDDKFVIQNFR